MSTYYIVQTKGEKYMSKCCEKCCRKVDVCNKEICGRPEFLSVYAPVIYDEIGVNVCRVITIPESVMEDNPTVETVRADVIDISLTKKMQGPKEMEDYKPMHHTETKVTSICKPNCSKVTLTNICVTYDVKLYDGCDKFLDSTMITVNYLPSDKYSPDYKYKDDKTNPSYITLELYTPYGVGTKCEGNKKVIHVVSMSEGNNQVVNGINLTGVGKAMNFDACEGTFSAGLSLILRTVYFEAYKIPYEGKTVPPKANTEDEEERVCKKFVESGLLSREIKPLELESPKCEGELKKVIRCERRDCTTAFRNNCGDEETKRDKCKKDKDKCEHERKKDED